MSNRLGPVDPHTAERVTSFTDILVALPETAVFASGRAKGPTTLEQIAAAKKRAEAEGFEIGVQRGQVRGRTEGRALGKEEGFQEVVRQHEEALNQFRDELGEILRRVESAIPAWYEACEESMTDLAIRAVSNLLHAELQYDRSSARNIVAEALRDVTHATEARIRINPLDLPLVSQSMEEIRSRAASLRQIEFVDDPSISAGCVIETDGGLVDATVEMGLRLIEQELRAA